MDDASLATRFTAIEQQLKLVSDHLGIPCPQFAGLALSMSKADTGYLGEVAALARAGKMIHAIKLYREHTGAGLAEAKAAVERL